MKDGVYEIEINPPAHEILKVYRYCFILTREGEQCVWLFGNPTDNYALINHIYDISGNHDRDRHMWTYDEYYLKTIEEVIAERILCPDSNKIKFVYLGELNEEFICQLRLESL